jgi:hypothetical protein
MGAERYQVSYHLMQVIYFEPGRALSGPEVAQLWSATRIFGKHRVVGNFWHAGELPSKKPRFEIGSVDFLKPLLAKSSETIYGGGTSARKDVARNGTVDSDFYFDHADPSRWQIGETMPTLLWSTSGQWLEQTGVDAVLNILKQNLAVADRHAPTYGLIDLAPSEDCYAGMCYVSTWVQRLPLHRWMEQGNWVYAASKKGDRARGIYWGNYFGPRILQRLGGREHFVRRYREQAQSTDGSIDALIWEFTNGVFVSLCRDPLGCKPGEPLDFSAMFNLRWLHHELGIRGVLCGWDANESMSAVTGATEPTASAPGELVAVSLPSQTSSPLSDAQLQGVSDYVSQARSLVQKYLAPEGAAALDPTILDRTFEAWQAAADAGEAAEDANDVVNAIGLGFGQHLVDSLGMEWAEITDAIGTAIGVRFGAGEDQIQAFPVNAVAKRLATSEPGFMQPLFGVIRAQVKAATRSKEAPRK